MVSRFLPSPPPNSASFRSGVKKESSSGNLTLVKTLLGEGPLVAWTEIPKLGKTPRGGPNFKRGAGQEGSSTESVK